MAAFFAFPTVWSDWVSPVSSLLPWLLLVWGGGTAVLGLASIFMYGNRTRQRQLVIITQWMTTIFAAALYSLLVAVDRFAAIFRGEIPLAFMVAVLLPVAAYIMFYMARRGIEHDIEKIRSVDRLR